MARVIPSSLAVWKMRRRTANPAEAAAMAVDRVQAEVQVLAKSELDSSNGSAICRDDERTELVFWGNGKVSRGLIAWDGDWE